MTSLRRVRAGLRVSAPVAWGVAFSVALAACGGRGSSPSAGIQPSDAVKAPADIRESFGAVPASGSTAADAPLAVANRYHLAVAKTSLEKEFLLSASLIDQTTAATSTGMRGRVVAFKHVGQSVFLLEATEGHVVTRDLPSNLILAELPVLRETETHLVLDFNQGMRRAFVVRGWYASEGTKTDYDPAAAVRSAKVGFSFLDKIEVTGDLVEVRQIAQFEMSTSSPTHEVRYFLRPYDPDPTYTPLISTDFTRVGFFEVPPVLDTATGRSIVRISRWHQDRPVVFHVSANTPAEYVESVKEGILYWNKAFGREVVRAEVAPEGVTAPDPHYNVIQWVPWDTAGFAYADALMDPRSGQILHGQSYLTSVFATAGKRRARTLLRRFKHLRERAESREADGHEHSELGIRFLESARLCGKDLASARTLGNFENSIARILAESPSEEAADEVMMRLSHDYVRFVTAHEVGHNLGLRHNFAGTLGGTLELEEKDELFARYLLEGSVPDPREGIVTTSVMDYMVFEDDVFTASQMALMDTALPYDVAAVRWAYDGRELSASTPLFCTDSQVPTFADCNRMDIGTDPLKSALHMVDFRLGIAPANLVEQFIAAKSPAEARDRKPFEAVVLRPSALAASLVNELKTALAWFRKDTRSLVIERQFPFIGELNADEVRSRRYDWVARQVDAAGGVDRLIFSLLPAADRASSPLRDDAMAALDAYLARPDVREFTGADGLRHSFSKEETAFIRRRASAYFAKVEEELLDQLLKALTASKFHEPSTLLAVEERLAAVAEKLVLDRGTREIDGPAGEYGGTRKVKDFRYGLETRIRAAMLLKGDIGDFNDWSFDSRAALKRKLTAAIEEVMDRKISEVKPAELPREKRRWYMDQLKVLQQL